MNDGGVTDREFDLLVKRQDRIEITAKELADKWEDSERHSEERDQAVAILAIKADAANESFKVWTRATIGGIVMLIASAVAALVAKGGP